DDSRSDKTITVRAAWRYFGKGHRIVAPSFRRRVAAVPAQHLPDGTVKADHVFRSGAFMQTIDVLCDERESRITPAPGSEHFMSAVGNLLGKHLTAPVVPLPYKPWISRERFGSGERFRAILLPDSIGPTECRDPACSGHAGARHHRDTCAGLKALRELLD